jgi:hypothetical protein
LEGRLVLSASIAVGAVTGVAPALVGAPVATNTTGGVGIIETPDKCVHGYKWRPPHPWNAAGAQTALMVQVFAAEQTSTASPS